MRKIAPNTKKETIENVRKHRPLYKIALYAGLLLILGLVVMFAIGPQRANLLNYAYGTKYSSHFFFDKQMASAIIAVVMFGTFAVIPHEFITKKYTKHILIAGLVVCALLFVMGAVLHLSIAQQTNGAYRWIYLGGLGSFQPSELLKFGILIFIAGFLGKRVQEGKINDFADTLIPLGVAVGVVLFIVVVLQKDLGTGISILAVILSMMFASGMDLKILSKVSGLLVIVGLVLVFGAPHRVERIMTFIEGDTNNISNDSSSYHIQQARIAIGSGGLFGLGIGKSVQATGYLPEAINDSIFAVMGETFGFLGLVIILLLFLMLLINILQVARQLTDMRLSLILVGVFGWIGSHMALNIAAMTGLGPLTGIPLPLLSSGGTSMMFIGAALGLCFQLSSYTVHKNIIQGGENDKNSRSRRRFGRSRYTSRGGI